VKADILSEYIWKLCQGHKEFLIFKVFFYATTSMSQKLFVFLHSSNNNKRLTTG